MVLPSASLRCRSALVILALALTACRTVSVQAPPREPVAPPPVRALPPAPRGPCTTGRAKDREVQRVIRRVWGRAAAAAIDVAACESREEGTDAVHGQYHGLFQLGQWARDRFGGGACAEQQAEAAFRYFVASHRRWTPWKCKPWRRRH